jgi:hypothetical protein
LAETGKKVTRRRCPRIFATWALDFFDVVSRHDDDDDNDVLLGMMYLFVSSCTFGERNSKISNKNASSYAP